MTGPDDRATLQQLITPLTNHGLDDFRMGRASNDELTRRVVDALIEAGWVQQDQEVEDLRSRLACVLEASYWDRPYDERLAAIRGMCDLTTNGMSPNTDEEGLAPKVARVTALAEEWECEPPGQHPTQHLHRAACPACHRADQVRAALEGAS